MPFSVNSWGWRNVPGGKKTRHATGLSGKQTRVFAWRRIPVDGTWWTRCPRITAARVNSLLLWGDVTAGIGRCRASDGVGLSLTRPLPCAQICFAFQQLPAICLSLLPLQLDSSGNASPRCSPPTHTAPSANPRCPGRPDLQRFSLWSARCLSSLLASQPLSPRQKLEDAPRQGAVGGKLPHFTAFLFSPGFGLIQYGSSGCLYDSPVHFKRLTFYLAFSVALSKNSGLLQTVPSYPEAELLYFNFEKEKRKEMPYNYCDISAHMIGSTPANIFNFHFEIFVGRELLLVFWKTDVISLCIKIDNYYKGP